METGLRRGLELVLPKDDLYFKTDLDINITVYYIATRNDLPGSMLRFM